MLRNIHKQDNWTTPLVNIYYFSLVTHEEFCNTSVEKLFIIFWNVEFLITVAYYIELSDTGI